MYFTTAIYTTNILCYLSARSLRVCIYCYTSSTLKVELTILNGRGGVGSEFETRADNYKLLPDINWLMLIEHPSNIYIGVSLE